MVADVLIKILHSRIFWACSIIASSAIFLSLIFQTTEKLLVDQTIVEIADKEVPVSDVPFPAVTVCPESEIFKKVLLFENSSRIFSEDE